MRRAGLCVAVIAFVIVPTGCRRTPPTRAQHSDAAASTWLPYFPAAAPLKGRGQLAGEMVSIPAGTFTMGTDKGDEDSRPAHAVRVAAFQMDRTEVTVGAYTACVSAKRCTPAYKTRDCNFGADKNDHPINCVDWNQAKTYCEAQGKRLPTEEEWEYAGRGVEGRVYPWGSAEPASERSCVDRLGGTCPVGAFPSGDSPLGLVDMEGNVAEWVEGGHSENYTKPRNPRRAVLRGGRWNDVGGVHLTYRSWNDATDWVHNLGFRCAK